MAGKRISPKKRHWAPFVVILAVAALVATIGGTMAWLTDDSSGLTNTFTPAQVEIKVLETLNENKTAKTSVSIENTGDADAYVRVTLASNWVKKVDNEWVVCGDAGHEHGAFTFDDSTLGSGWTKIGGYYYYTSPVKPGNTNATNNLLAEGKSIALAGETDSCMQQVIVLAQAIQAEPADAIKDAWKIDSSSWTVITE